jgi:hypothetical protein
MFVFDAMRAMRKTVLPEDEAAHEAARQARFYAEIGTDGRNRQLRYARNGDWLITSGLQRSARNRKVERDALAAITQRIRELELTWAPFREEYNSLGETLMRIKLLDRSRLEHL